MPLVLAGQAHLEEALQRTGIEAEVEFHSYELQPEKRPAQSLREYAAERFGDPHALDVAHGRLEEMGRPVGLAYDFDRVVAANTFDAHRVHHLAKSRGLGNEVMERLMRARQAEGADVGDPAALRRLAVEAGLQEGEVSEVLAGDRFAHEVRADEELARRHGIRGVPFVVLAGKYALSGAQPVEVFEEALRRAERELR